MIKMNEYRLALAIILQATRDWDSHPTRELADFFTSSWFDVLCQGCGISPDKVRDALKRPTWRQARLWKRLTNTSQEKSSNR